jgi:pimeloyl-ACP methyl ester carboxylesterase
MVPVARGEQLQRGLLNARLQILEGAGHQVHSEQFAPVVRLLLDFVDDVERRRT